MVAGGAAPLPLPGTLLGTEMLAIGGISAAAREPTSLTGGGTFMMGGAGVDGGGISSSPSRFASMACRTDFVGPVSKKIIDLACNFIVMRTSLRSTRVFYSQFINKYILLTVLHISFMLLVRRICLKIKAFHLW